ncbi:MAG: alpha-L-fucosidase, partial [Bacteroidota bacterium]|nr:alpha-L-fucosidase [Bacteroidota bacterium]
MKSVLIVGLFWTSLSIAQKNYEPTWQSLDKRATPEWFSNAKFGIFIHWGLYSVPGYTNKGTYAEWYWNALNEDPNTENLKRRERHHAITKFHNKNYGLDYDYAKFREDFKAELFNPKEWADIFKRSGAKYVVLTSKHHDGYCLWPNNESSESYNMPWNSVDSGPKRDLVGDLTTAVRGEGIKMGLYYSIWDWYNPYWTKQQQQIMSSGSLSVDISAAGDKKSKISHEDIAAAKAGLDKYVHEVMYPQVRQLINEYEPALLFSD